MVYLNDKVVSYLNVNSITFAPGDYHTGQPAGEEDQILHWNIEALGPIPTADQLNATYETKLAADAMIAYREQRAVEYPLIGDQLDALWKGGDAAADMLAQIRSVKAKYPKPE
jgi:hypothetical protein